MTESNIQYWPFPVLPLEQRTEHHWKVIRFLEETSVSGFRAGKYLDGILDGEYLVEAVGGRCGTIYYRGGNRWELGLYENQTRPQAFWTDDFAQAGAAVLVWLRGGNAADILAAVEGHVIRGQVILEPAAADGAPAS